MRNKPSSTERVRDSALDDDLGIDRALEILLKFNHVYGRDRTTKKYLNELADILIGVQQRARQRHQAAERIYQAARDDEEYIAQLM